MTKVDLITGFLGAGKTTFIMRYAKWLDKRGIKTAVIENEFGTAGCDGALLKDIGLQVSELSGGCICCSLKVDFAFALNELSGRFDRVIVEPSGIFSPRDFFEVMGSPMLEGKCEVGFVAAIVNPLDIDSISGEASVLFRAQLDSAGIVLMSMTDDMTPARRDAAALRLIEERGCETHIRTEPWHEFSDADFEMIMSSGAVCSAKSESVVNHANIFSSASIALKRAFTRAELYEKLEAIMLDEGCGIILRIKGAVPSADGGALWVSCTPSKITLESIAQGRPLLNVIGKGLMRSRIQSELHKPLDFSVSAPQNI